MEVPEGAKAGDLIGLAPYEFQLEGSKKKYAAERGTLVVPENWEKAESRLIALPVVRIPASGANPAEPVFFLQGGPGVPNLLWAPPDWLLKNHDVVMVGYRGAEGSVVLSCPEADRVVKAHMGKDLFSEQARAEYTTAIKQYAAMYQEAGVDLSGYTMPCVVKDMESARKALRYGKINLFSESYGTRVAQIYAYMYPESLHRLVLIGVNTPGHFIWNPAVFDKMIGHISELYAKEVPGARANDFAQMMYNVNRKMPKRWLFFNIDPDTVRLCTHMAFFSNRPTPMAFFNRPMPMAFDAYLAAAKGDFSGLAMMNLIAMILPLDSILGEKLCKGGTADLDKFGGIESISLGDSIMGAPLSEVNWPTANEWPMELIPKELREFQETDVEMLLVNGTVDFSTPPTALEEAKPYFHKAQMVLLPEFSHCGDVEGLQPEAYERLITSYYDTGVADDSLFRYEPLSFKARISLTLVAKLLLFPPFLVILGIALAVLRFRRSKPIKIEKVVLSTSQQKS